MANLREDFNSLYLSAFELTTLTQWPDAVIDDYIAILRGMIALADQLDASTMRVATGAPENVVTANDSRQYFDLNANKFYINPVIGAKTGWVAIN